MNVFFYKCMLTVNILCLHVALLCSYIACPMHKWKCVCIPRIYLRKWVLIQESEFREKSNKENLINSSGSKQIAADMNVYRQNEKLKNAKKDMFQTETTALEVQILLHKNTETMGRSIQKVICLK